MSTPEKKDEPVKKATRIASDAHATLKAYCDRTGRTQVDVLTELTHRFIKPELERLRAEANG